MTEENKDYSPNTEIIINDLVKVNINEDSFNASGEMSVEFDDTKITEAEATAMVNEYFEKVMEILKLREQEDKLLETQSKIGEPQ